MEWINRHKKHMLDMGLLLIFLLVFFSVRGSVNNVITPFIYALVVAYLLNPAVKMLEKRKIKRGWAILIVFIFIISLLSLIFMSFIPKLANDLLGFDEEIPQIFEFLQSVFNEIKEGRIPFVPDFLADFIDVDHELEKMGMAFRGAFSNLSSKILASTGTLLDIVMTPIITFYYLKDKERLLGTLSSLIQKERYKKIGSILNDINRVLGGFIKGQLIVAAFVGVLTGVGCAVIGVPYALTIGFVAGITNIVPYFGPWIGGILPVLLALMHHPIMAVWVTLWIVIVQQIESSFISPQVMSHSVGLHPLTVIFSVLFFGNMFGILGMIIGVPLMGTIKVLIKYVLEFREHYRKTGVFFTTIGENHEKVQPSKTNQENQSE